MQFQDLNDALSGPLLASARGFGLSLKDVGAALATYGDDNIRGADAATQLRMAIQYMAKPAATAAPVLKALGLNTQSFANAMAKGGLMPALTLLHDRLKAAGVQGAQTSSVLLDIFSKKGTQGIQTLLNSYDKLRGKYVDVGKGQDAVAASWRAYTQTAQYKFDKLKTTIQESAVRIGAALLPIVEKYLPGIAHGVESVAKWFTHLSKPLQVAIVGFTAFLAIGGPILIMIGSLVTAIGVIGEAFEGLGVIMDAIPEVALFAALAVGLIELDKHFGAVKAAAVDAWNWIKQGAADVLGWLKKNWPLVAGILLAPFTLGMSPIVGLFHKQIIQGAEDVFNWIKSHWPLLAGILLAPFTFGLSLIWVLFHKKIIGAARAVISFLGSAWKSVTNVLTWPFKELIKIAEKAFGVVSKVTGFLGKVKHFGGSLVHTLTGGLFHSGGHVKQQPIYRAMGGPSGTDTVPAWLTPGEYVMSAPAVQRIGVPTLNAMNSGMVGSGQNQQITIEPGNVILRVDGKTLAKAVVNYTLRKGARGPSSLVGGSLATGVSSVG